MHLMLVHHSIQTPFCAAATMECHMGAAARNFSPMDGLAQVRLDRTESTLDGMGHNDR